MADNIDVTPGTGKTIAGDDVGGALYQRVKLAQGADGSATDVSSAAPLQVTLANTGANTNKLLTTPDLPSGASTAAKQPSLGTAGTASTDVISVQGIASMTKLLVTPDSVALPANQSVNISQINAVTPLMGNGVTGTGSPRVTIASDNTAFSVNAVQSGTWTVQPGNTANTTAWKVDGSAVTQPVSGTVTANAGSGTFTISGAVTVADGASVTLGAKADAKSTATDTTAITAMSVLKQISASVQAPPSQAVTNAGTFAVQAAITAASGSISSGAIASGALASGSIAVGAIAAGATSIADNEDAASADGDRGVKILARRTATPANTSGTDLDYEMLQLNAGRLWVDPSGVTLTANATLSAETTKVIGTVNQGTSPWIAAGGGTAGSAASGVVTVQGIASMTKLLVTPDANSAVNVAQINGVTTLMGNGATGTGSQRVTISNDNTGIANWGQGATGSAVPAGASYKGGLAKTALPTAASDGNLTGAMTDKYGRQVVLQGTIRDLTGTQTTTISASTTETTIVTAASSIFNDLVMLIISNTSASTNTRIDFRDTTGGSVLFSLQSNGGQPPVGFALPVPIPQTTVNTNWTAQCATSTTDVRIYAVFAKNK